MIEKLKSLDKKTIISTVIIAILVIALVARYNCLFK